MRHGYAVRAAILEANFHRQNSRTRLLKNMYAPFLRRNDAKLREQKPRPDDRMSRKPQLFFRCENAQARECFLIRGLLHEDRLGKVHLAGNRQHLIVGELVAIGENGEWIAGKARGRENIKRVVAVFHGGDSRARSGAVQMRWSRATVLSFTIFPVFKVVFGSISTTCTSSSAVGQCSTPRG